MRITRKKSKLRVLTALAAVLLIQTGFIQAEAAAKYTPTVDTVKIGLSYGSSEIPSGNLQNVSGMGSGYEFGYYDGNRDFVYIGASTAENAISIVMDRNMIWRPEAAGGFGEYQEIKEDTAIAGDSVILGCYHIMQDVYYATYEEAAAAAAVFSEDNAFVRYASGYFYIGLNNYTTNAAAEEAIAAKGLTGFFVDSGTVNTITVVRRGANVIVFEYDFGGTFQLAVRPKRIADENPETWYKGYKYCGGFEYSRRTGNLITVINYVELEEYIKGVLPYEMNNAWPMEALKAQACCARTFALAQLGAHASNGFDLCTTEDCQVYCGRGASNARTDQAVGETAGKLITHNGSLCTAYYASSNGGASENSENVWSGVLPYLRGVVDPYEADIVSKVPNYYWTITYTPEQITQRLRDRGTDCAAITGMEVSEFTPTGNVLSVKLTDENGKTYTFSKREALISALGTPTQHFTIGSAAVSAGSAPKVIYGDDPARAINPGSEVYSLDGGDTAQTVDIGTAYAITGSGDIQAVIAGAGTGGTGSTGSAAGPENGVFTISGSGRGHSLGMSQWGAYSMAEYHGKSYLDIISFYFTGVEVG